MPTDGCSVCMPIIIINSKFRGGEQDFVQYMMKVILMHTPVECGVVDPYVDRFINQEESKVGNNQGEQSEGDTNNSSSNPEKENYNKGHIVIAYTQGLGESIKNMQKVWIQTYIKGNRTIRNILLKPKDKDALNRKSGLSICTSVWTCML